MKQIEQLLKFGWEFQPVFLMKGYYNSLGISQGFLPKAWLFEAKVLDKLKNYQKIPHKYLTILLCRKEKFSGHS